MSPKTKKEQFFFRVRKAVDCIVMVEARTQAEADEAVKDAGQWLDEQDVECPDWEIRGRA